MIGQETAVRLIAAARDARTRAYAPYSRFSVGAAILTRTGQIHVGANVENASYSLCVCAERVAAVRAVVENDCEFVAIACSGGMTGSEPDAPCSPCGACRQFLHEFSVDAVIVTEGSDSVPVIQSLASLLPGAFGPSNLAFQRG